MTKTKTKITQKMLVLQYFTAHEGEKLDYWKVSAWVKAECKRLGLLEPKDLERLIRSLGPKGEGLLQRDEEGSGVYWYDSTLAHARRLKPFPPKIREQIFKRDNYECVFCGRGPNKQGDQYARIYADHKDAMSNESSNDFSNGQTVCSEHNNMKKNRTMTQAGKKFFATMYRDAVDYGDEALASFCVAVFDVYDSFGVDTDFPRPDKNEEETAIRQMSLPVN